MSFGGECMFFRRSNVVFVAGAEPDITRVIFGGRAIQIFINENLLKSLAGEVFTWRCSFARCFVVVIVVLFVFISVSSV